jgi:opacity protein-like surface antigen
MRKLMISLAAAGTALAFATPAAAQYYPAPQSYNGYNGYGYNGYGYNGYGYGNFDRVRGLQARIDSIQYQIRRLDRRDVIRDRSADRLKDEANRIENRLHRAARYGLNGYEANDIQARIANLEQRVRYAVANGYGRYGRYSYNSYSGYGDRDGRWDHDRDDD